MREIMFNSGLFFDLSVTAFARHTIQVPGIVFPFGNPATEVTFRRIAQFAEKGGYRDGMFKIELINALRSASEHIVYFLRVKENVRTP